MPDPISGDEAKTRIYEIPPRTTVPYDVVFLGDGPATGPSSYEPQDVISSAVKRITLRPGLPPAGSSMLIIPPGTGSAHRYDYDVAVAAMTSYYLGPYAAPPIQDRNDDPLVPGQTYFDTVAGEMFVYNAAGQWTPVAQSVPSTIRVYIYSIVVNSYFVPPLDDFGRAVDFDVSRGDAVSLYINGARQVGGIDYILHLDGSISLPVSLISGNIVEIQVLGRPELSFLGAPLAIDTSLWLFDGENATFPLESPPGTTITPASTTACTVVLNGNLLDPSTAYTVLAGTITFTTPPYVDSVAWMLVSLDNAVGDDDLPGILTAIDALELADSTFAAQLALKAPLLNPALSGTPTGPTASPGASTTQLATTAFVTAAVVAAGGSDPLKANLASPTFTGVPAAPTAAALTSTTQLATTAFATAADAAVTSAYIAADALKAPIGAATVTATGITLAASHANGRITVTATGQTITIPSAATLGFFECEIYADGFAVTLDGTGGTNVTLAAGEVATVFTANSKVVVAKGVGVVVS